MQNSFRSGFVAVVGRPNCGKSTLLNKLLKQEIALVSHKANATRKKMNIIIPFVDKNGVDSQIIFVDTPGLHHQEKLLNQFMLKEALRAISDCDLCVFMSSIHDDLKYYEEFLTLSEKPHILVLSKTDTANNEEILKKIAEYQKYDNKFLSLIPISTQKSLNLERLLEEVSRHLPYSPPFFDTEIITDENLKQIYKEIIRESVFNNLSDEIPYESDVRIEKFIESPRLDKIFAKVFVEKESQKSMVIGKNAQTIKRIGKQAREKMEKIGEKKIFLELNVFVQKSWSKEKENLKKFGYNFED
ncbi:GTPase Era [Helicobacter cappadocius]|uniref:GTPase Era n=1 Tax=Helicobacter cappadocius TaxID=3063998 RepID=A0AA90ST81_9HELI|nr:MULTISPECIES: GTPase Era [unclassified Helicobacter]MDO7253815.1 GTPase Era [Helicobacter sp. faydin-H75]MDP2539704.1 GTPase Era [Helicobacter sp. faydin-H76]